MSASRERKQRQEFLAGGGVSKKAAREAERKAAERRSNILYASLAGLFVIVAIALVVYNSGIFQRNTTAVTIGDDTYTAADLSYYYYQSLNNLYNQTSGYPSAVGLDLNTSFKEQKAWGSTEEDAQTWDAYFKEQAVEEMKYVSAAKAAAAAEGFTLSEEDEAGIASSIQTMKDNAASNGVSYSRYLENMYGSLMTVSCFEKNLRENYLASAYATAYSDSLVYTEDQVKAVYDANPENYDKVEYMMVTVNGAAASTEDEEGNTVEPTEEESAAAWEDAQNTAQTILDAYDAGEELGTVAEDFETATYSSSEGASNSGALYTDWCFEDGRKAGDSTIIEDEDNSKIYVVVFLNRFLDETKTVNVRHILITEDSVDVADDVVPMDEEIKARAEEILAMWDGTEEGFAQLAREYSKDGTASQGGLYENVYKGEMVAAFEDWCFDSSRKAGDTGIVKSDYGYHIIYFVGDDQPMWYINAENTLRTPDMTEWEENLVASYEAVTSEKGMNYVGR